MSAQGAKDKKDERPDEDASEQGGKPQKAQGNEVQDEADAKTKLNVANFQDKVEIACDKPLPIYNAGVNRAYRAHSKDSKRAPFIAIVCEYHIVPRRLAADVYKSIDNPSSMKLLLHGVVYWPPEKRELYVFVYKDNLGAPLLRQGHKAALGWKQDQVMSAIVKPMADLLQDFRDKEFIHGCINPYNMFDVSAAGEETQIVLGECLSLPPSCAQPSIYEPVRRGMADSIARGKGSAADDLYALGASIAVIMRQNDPMEGLSEEEALREKIVRGSYGAITGKDRFKGEILELLRGLLHDDPTQRWTIDEVLSWLDGRRLSPKQASVVRKASRSFLMGEDRYFIPQLIAMDVEEKIKNIKDSIQDGSLLNWIERSLEDEEMSEHFQKAVVDARRQSAGMGYESCLAGNVSISFDPEAPLRFKGLSLMGDGIGPAIVRAAVLKQSMGPYAEVFLNSLIVNWLAMQNSSVVDVPVLFSRFERCRRYLKTSKIGQGIERAIYTLCPESPCLSDVVKDYYVIRPNDLLLAYEDLCQKGKAPSIFLDPHAVAFLYEKDQKVIEAYIYDLNTHENHRVSGANLKCLAVIQKRYNMDALPGIAKALAPRLTAVIERYHDRRIRNKLEESVFEFQSTGDLVKLAAIFENVEISKKDLSQFYKAMQEFGEVEKERQMLEARLKNKETFGIEAGKDASVVFSGFLALLIVLGTAFLFFSNKTLF